MKRQLVGPLLIAAFAAMPCPAQQRALTVDDLFRLETVGSHFPPAATFSPDGALLAYVRIRPRAEGRVHDAPYLGGNDRADVWVVPGAGGEPTNITRGAVTGTGAWSPRWSPDGSRLAMYCTDGDDIFLCIWREGEEEIRRLAGGGGLDLVPGGPVWFSSTELVNPVLPPGRTSSALSVLRQTPEIAMAAWPRIRDGEEPTASVLDSGGDGLESGPTGRLVLFDVTTGAETVLYEGDAFDPVVAPGGGRVAVYVRTRFIAPEPGRPLLHRPDHWIHEVRILDRNGVVAVDSLEGLSPVIRRSGNWSPDGRRLVFALDAEGGDGASAVALRVADLSTRELLEYPIEGLSPHPSTILFLPPPKLRWTEEGDLLLRAREVSASRMDWWLLQGPNRRLNLTADLPSPPEDLIPAKGNAGFVGVAGGEVWRVARDGSEELSGALQDSVIGLAWPAEETTPDAGVDRVIVRTTGEEGGREATLSILDVRDGSVLALPRPGSWRRPWEAPELVAVSPSVDRVVFDESDRGGTVLWLADAAGGDPRAVFETNGFLDGVAEASHRLIRYRGLEGDSLTAWLLLPPQYEEGRSYPLVTWVYAGSVADSDAPSSLSLLNEPHPLNRQLLAARGYAVLSPSMPLTVQGEANDPYLELTRGVLPAVDRAVELGIADPERLAVMGQSYGGYSTYALVTLTDRFDAAVALAGLTDLVGLYGTLTGRNRYQADAHRDFFRFSISETGQTSMGSPPWEDLQRYLRNSPISYVHRVNTPLLAIHGDLDYVPMEQAEEFFMSLVRQDKRARFVRYWGEGHVFSSPANIRHMWGQIFTWLDEFLPEDEPDEVTGGRP